MTPSESIAAFMRGFEKLARIGPDGRIYAYMPTPNDRWTIGYGETKGITQRTVWSREQAESNFKQRLAALGASVWALVQDVPTSQSQFDAMVSLADNIGLAAFKSSTVLRQHRAGQYGLAAVAFGLWNKQAGAVLAGLTRRRAAEAVIYKRP